MGQKKVTFFFESYEHEKFLENVISLVQSQKYDVDFIVLTDKNKFANKYSKIKIRQTKNIFLNSLILQNINSEFLITTTPSFGSRELPMSKNIKYIYYFHSLVSSINIYPNNSFVNFDYISYPNKIIFKELLQQGVEKQKLFDGGYPYLINKNLNKKKGILIAPTWGPASLLEQKTILEKFIKINSDNFDIYFKFHPMESNENIKFVNKISKKYANIHLLDSLINEFDYLITDWSGIAIEYFYLTKGKILFVDTEQKHRNDFLRLDKTSIENKMRNVLGESVTLKFFANINLLDYKFLNYDSQIATSFINSLIPANNAELLDNILNILND